MVELWVFIVACVVFIGIMGYQYYRNRKLENINGTLAYFLDRYVKRHGEALLQDDDFEIK